MWGGARRGNLEHPPNLPETEIALPARVRTAGDPGLGGSLGGSGGGGRASGGVAGAGGVRTPVTEPPPTRLAPWHSAALFTSWDFFFFPGLLVSGQSCSDLTTQRLEEGGGKQETILWDGVGQEVKCAILGVEKAWNYCFAPNPCRMGNWFGLG